MENSQQLAETIWNWVKDFQGHVFTYAHPDTYKRMPASERKRADEHPNFFVSDKVLATDKDGKDMLWCVKVDAFVTQSGINRMKWSPPPLN